MRLADFIEAHAPQIVEGAAEFALSQAPAGVELSAKELRNHLPQILKAIVLDLRSTQTRAAQQAKSEGRAPPSSGPESAASYHGRTRAAAGFGLNQMVAEYRALRAAVLRLWADHGALAESGADLVRFNEAIDQALAESLAEYSAEVESWRQIFLGALGHDLRGPLTAVVLSADMLMQKTRGTPYAPYVERILSGGERMSQLLDDLLAYSRSKLGVGMDLQREICDLRAAVADEVELLRAALPATSIQFDAAGTTQGRFDASRVREALHNLVTNAAKYGDADAEVWVEVTGDADCVRISVRNAGAPLTDEALLAMFDPLRRGAKNASAGEHLSLGLGLFLVREIATAHGGKVTGDSADGYTTFVMALPRDA
ncbi:MULTISPECIES: sensor histidine kinase [Luteimonas]|uniref:histidine kinase n=1 Tax=Luteimonas chenhongjianii TaxID=2006110 RepID=A0A290XC09_9GAMM|nr:MULTISPECIES: sensor histidine kinase [Luteimonas]ATD66694.1 two-component sensor histidine kinase [Luteimonas chenhongjianii]RPD83891.1 two-component sensor histidine kinase [Luteimonas sp. 100069]